MADLDALFHVLPVMFDAAHKHQSKSHALNHFLAFGLSMEDRRLSSFMYEKSDVVTGRRELARTVDNGGVQHWMETVLRPYLRHGVQPAEYLAVHKGVAATAIYLGAWIPRYFDTETERIHVFTLKALIILMALESVALVWGSKDTVHTTVEASLRAVEARKEFNRWIARLEELDERVARHNIARADEEKHPFSDIELEFLGHEEKFAHLRGIIAGADRTFEVMAGAI